MATHKGNAEQQGRVNARACRKPVFTHPCLRPEGHDGDCVPLFQRALRPEVELVLDEVTVHLYQLERTLCGERLDDIPRGDMWQTLTFGRPIPRAPVGLHCHRCFVEAQARGYDLPVENEDSLSVAHYGEGE